MKKILIVFSLISLFLLTGCSGKSAYDLAVDNGFNGTIEDYLESLKGDDAPNITIIDIFNSLVEKGEYEENEYSKFINDYLNDYLKDSNDEEVVINNSLKSTVSIQTVFGTSAYAGAGVVYEITQDNEAYIITNHHVVSNPNDKAQISTNISVMFYGMEYKDFAYSATYIGSMTSYDISVIKVQLDEQTAFVEPVKIATSRVYAGDTAYAIGNPLGYGLSITKGIVSVDSEVISTSGYSNLRVLRIDASVNGGNSGGGLFNKYGELIGIVDAKIIDEQVEGIGYAIPVSAVDGIAENIIRNQGEVKKVVLGVTPLLTSSYMMFDDLAQKYYIKEKITIQSISMGSPAFTAGLESGSELVSATIKGQTYLLERTYILSDLLFKVSENEEITIRTYKNGMFKDTVVTMKC